MSEKCLEGVLETAEVGKGSACVCVCVGGMGQKVGRVSGRALGSLESKRAGMSLSKKAIQVGLSEAELGLGGGCGM